LVRYCTRPPLSQQRLERLNDQTLVYSLRKLTLDSRTELIQIFSIFLLICTRRSVSLAHTLEAKMPKTARLFIRVVLCAFVSAQAHATPAFPSQIKPS
jgi:hypothetical protein